MKKKKVLALMCALFLVLTLASCKKISCEGSWYQGEGDAASVLQLMDDGIAVLYERNPDLLLRGVWEETDEGITMTLGDSEATILRQDDILRFSEEGEAFVKGEDTSLPANTLQNFILPVWHYNDGSGTKLRFDTNGGWKIINGDKKTMYEGRYVYENEVMTLSGGINTAVSISDDLGQLTIDGWDAMFYDEVYIDPALIVVGESAYLDYCWFDEDGWEFAIYSDLSWAIYNRTSAQAHGLGEMQDGMIVLSGDVQGMVSLSVEKDVLIFSSEDGPSHEFMRSQKRR